MKRRELIRKLEVVGYSLLRARGPHDIYRCPGRPNLSIPRHSEVKEPLARKILREAGAE